jgi:hypothetical protein
MTFATNIESGHHCNECAHLEKENEKLRHSAAIVSEGYHRLDAENKKLREALKLQEEYTVLLIEEIDSLIPMAHTHGWRSTRAEKGKELRERIEAARKLLEAGE